MADYAAAVTVSLDGGAVPGSAWHGWLYRILGERADTYHEAGMPPFALQPAEGWVRVVLLDGSLAGTLGIRRGTEGPEGRTVKSADWEIRPYQTLLVGGARPPGQVTLQFVTPVAFRQGPYTMLVPLPRLVFGGLKRVWDNFAALPLAGFDPAACERSVEMSWIRLTTRQFDTGLGVFRGAVGQVTYRCGDRQLGDALQALAGFAELAGVGAKRAFGMGSIRWLAEASP